MVDNNSLPKNNNFSGLDEESRKVIEEYVDQWWSDILKIEKEFEELKKRYSNSNS